MDGENVNMIIEALGAQWPNLVEYARVCALGDMVVSGFLLLIALVAAIYSAVKIKRAKFEDNKVPQYCSLGIAAIFLVLFSVLLTDASISYTHPEAKAIKTIFGNNR